MYEKFYGFKENPFTITPDPKFFFPSPKHTEVLDSLIYTVTERRGFAVITGEIGSGKTTICRTLLSRLSAGTKVAMITNTYLSPKELLSYTLEELGVTFDGGEKSNLLSCLKKFLVEQLYLDFNVVLIIDEAQNLSLKVLEEIRMLSNLETEKKKMLQIILTGQPALKDKLASEELAQLRQRINVQYHIPPLNRINNERYIKHRLDVASINGNRKVEFTPEAIDKIYDYSQGIPRAINMLCNNALLIGYVTEATQITLQIIKEAIEEFQNETKVDKPIVSLPQARQSQLKETGTKLEELNAQLEKVQKELRLSESSLSKKQTELVALIEGVNQTQKEFRGLEEQKHKSQQEQEELNQAWLKLKAQQEKEQEELLGRLKSTQEELNRYHSEATKRQSDLEQINKDLQSRQETLGITQSLVNQKNSELQVLLEETKAKQSQLQEAESKLTQLNAQLNQLQKDKEEASEQLQSAHGTLINCESSVQEKTLELKELIKKIDLVKEELKNLQEQKHKSQEELTTKQSQLQATESKLQQLNEELDQINKSLESSQKDLSTTESKCQQKYSELGQVTLQLDQAKQQKQSELKELNHNITELREELKNLQEQKIRYHEAQEKLNKGIETKIPKQPESKQIIDLLNKKPIIKLKVGQRGAQRAVLTASASGGEIKIGPLGNDDSLRSVYSGIRTFHRNGDAGTYKNFIFFAKGEKKRDYLTEFRIELGNGTMKIGKHHNVMVTDSWQKFNIPLEDFSRMINLNTLTEIAFFPNAPIEADDITYIKDIYFSNG